MSLGQAGGSVLGGPTKIGNGASKTIPASTWTEIVLQDLSDNPRPYPRQRYSLVCLGNVYVAQANHGLTNRPGDTLPANPATPSAGVFLPGYAFLLASTYLTFEAERVGENSLWIWSAAGTTAYVTNLTYTEYDDQP